MGGNTPVPLPNPLPPSKGGLGNGTGDASGLSVLATGGSIARAIADRANDRRGVAEWTLGGAPGTVRTTDDTAAIQAAVNAIAGTGGTVYLLARAYLIDSADLIIPSNVELAFEGGVIGERSDHAYAWSAGTLNINPAYTIRLSQRASLRGVVVVRKGVAVAASMRDSLNQVASFSGTGVTAIGSDAALSHVMILGFATCVSAVGVERPRLDTVLGDGINGFVGSQIHDVARLNSVQFWPFITAHYNWTITSLAISGVADNGSGLIRVTLSSAPTTPLVTGDIVTISGVGGFCGANREWTITVIDGTHVDLQGSSSVPAALTATTTVNSYVLGSLSSTAGLAAGQQITGSGIQANTTIVAVLPLASAVVLSSPMTVTATGVTVTPANAVYTSGGTLYVNTNRRSGIGFSFDNTESPVAINCYAYGFKTGFYLGAAAGWVQLINPFVDNNLAASSPDTVGVLVDSTSYDSAMVGGYISSQFASVVNRSTGAGSFKISASSLNGVSAGATVQLLSGRTILTTSDWGGGPMVIGTGVGFASITGNDLPNTAIRFQDGTAASKARIINTVSSVGGTNAASINVGIAAGPSNAISIEGYGLADPSQGSQISFRNTAPGSSLNSYSMRCTQSGNFEFLNYNYLVSLRLLAGLGVASLGATLDGSGQRVTLTGSAYTIPQATSLIRLIQSSTVASQTINLPTALGDGHVIQFVQQGAGAVTALTFSPAVNGWTNGSQLNAGPGIGIRIRWDATAGAWYREQ